MPTFDSGIFVLGALGGILPDVIRIIREKRKKTFPAYYKSVKFWLGTVFSCLLGGLAAWLLGAPNAQSAIAFGFAAPELFTRLGASSDEPDRSSNVEFSLRQWWAI